MEPEDAAGSMEGNDMSNDCHSPDNWGMAVCNGMPVCCHSSVFDRWAFLHSTRIFMLCVGCSVEPADH